MGNFRKDSIYHVYQRAKDGGVIFYGLYDRLIFTLMLRFFRDRHRISLLAVSIMYNHYHLLVKSPGRKNVSDYIRDVTSYYVRVYNSAARKSGHLFKKGCGCAEKWSDKYIRTVIAYVYNNHGEKKLCSNALEMRWNFLAYAFSPNPFSKKIVLSSASRKFRKARSSALIFLKNPGTISYGCLESLYSHLDSMESEQLTDFIISQISLVDYKLLFSFYKTPEDMVRAISSVAGSEHDINEPVDMGDDRPYRQYLKILKNQGYSTISKDFLILSKNDKYNLISRLRESQIGSYEHVKRFLHL